MHKRAIWLATILLLTGCAPSAPATAPPTQIPTHSPPTNTPPPTATTVPTPIAEELSESGRTGDPLPIDTNELFSTSGACSVCHTKMQSDTGETVSLDATWRASMKANAARDPYFLATLRTELNENPDLAETIEDQCATCHMPMARVVVNETGEPGRIFGEHGLLDPDNDLHSFAMDGVSCSVCHQIEETGLGTEASFSGGFRIDTVTEKPDRVIFGPYTTETSEALVMQATSGFIPQKSEHLSRAALCGSCHTLYTPYVDSSGNILGEFPEQMPFFEWYYSDFRRSQTCQDCHMPEVDGGVRISNLSRTLRSPFSKHSFVGGNAFMLHILDTFGDELGVTASSEDFEAAIDRTVEQLRNHTAEIEVENVQLLGNRVLVDILLTNLAGHKFPTAFPSRRAWIHVVLRDADGEVVFESGAYSEDGSITGNDNDEDPEQYEIHYDGIVQSDQVQIYEAVLRDSGNAVTTRLLQAAGYLKDNRLLPAGFEKGAPYEDIAVRGRAREDVNFLDGGDQIQYAMSLGSAPRPYTFKVELLYQAIGFRWAQNLRGGEGSEIERFNRYYDSTPNLPVVIDSVEVEIGAGS